TPFAGPCKRTCGRRGTGGMRTSAMGAVLLAAVLTEYTVDGTVKQVDAARFTVTIVRTNGKELTVRLDSKTEIRYDGKRSTFQRIKAKQEVRIVFDPETRVASWFGTFDLIDRPRRRGR